MISSLIHSLIQDHYSLTDSLQASGYVLSSLLSSTPSYSATGENGPLQLMFT